MWISGGIALLLAAGLVFVVRRGMDARFVASAIWLAAMVLLVLSPALRTYSAHGMWHVSMVNTIHAGGIPPENPLFAGDPLRYSYGFHALVAAVMHLVPLAPVYAFQALNVFGLAVFLWLVFRSAQAMGLPTGAQSLAVLLSVISVNPFANVLIKGTLLGADPRSIPLNKFTMINTTQLGYVVLAGVLYLAIAQVKGRTGRAHLGLPALCFIEGVMYPMLWPVALLWSGLVGILSPELRRNRMFVASMLGSVLAVLPFFYLFAHGKSQAASLTVWPTLANAGEIARFLVVPAVICGLARWLPHHETDDPTMRLLLWSVAGTLGGYLLVDGPDGVQYKLLAAAAFPAALLLAVPLGRMYAGSIFVVPLIALLLLHDVAVFARRSRVVMPAQPVVFNGKRIVPGEASEAAMAAWVRTQTDADAVFIDDTRSMPVHAMRSLYAATNSTADTDEYEGWTFRSERLVLVVSGTEEGWYRKRLAHTRAILDGTFDASTFEQVVAELPDRPIYVVSRGVSQQRAFRGVDALRFERAFGDLSLFRLLSPESS